MAAVADPVGRQLIASLARPGANVTGLASQAEDIMPRMLVLFASVLPRAAAVAVLVDGSSAVHPRMWLALGPIAQRLGVQLLRVEAGRRPGDETLSAAFDAAVGKRAAGILVLPDALPAATRILPRLTVLAALGCVVLQVMAMSFNVARGELGVLPLNAVLLSASAFVLWGRGRRLPIATRR